MLWAVLSEELVHHIQPKLRRTKNATAWKRTLNKDGEPNEIFECATQFLQIQFDVCEHCAPLRSCIANKTSSLFFGWIIIVSRRRVSTKVNNPLCTANDCTFSPRHQPAVFKFLMGHQFHIA